MEMDRQDDGVQKENPPEANQAGFQKDTDLCSVANNGSSGAESKPISAEGAAGDDIFGAAKEWHARGFNVLPLKRGTKQPALSRWEPFQERRVTKEELRKWKAKFAGGLGVVTGKISGIVVLDSDGELGESVLHEFEKLHGTLPKTLVVRSGSGRGLHRYYRHPGFHVVSRANKSIELDVRGDGGFIVLPPSSHISGGQYVIVDDAPIAELPQALLSFIEEAATKAASFPKAATEREAPNVFAAYDVSAFIPNNAPPTDEMSEMLKFLKGRGHFEGYDSVKDAAGRIVNFGWLQAGMALKAAYGDKGQALWGFTHRDDEARRAARSKWKSFASEARPGDVTTASIVAAARDAGFEPKRKRAEPPADGVVLRDCEAIKKEMIFAHLSAGVGRLSRGVVWRGEYVEYCRQFLRRQAPFEQCENFLHFLARVGLLRRVGLHSRLKASRQLGDAGVVCEPARGRPDGRADDVGNALPDVGVSHADEERIKIDEAAESWTKITGQRAPAVICRVSCGVRHCFNSLPPPGAPPRAARGRFPFRE